MHTHEDGRLKGIALVAYIWFFAYSMSISKDAQPHNFILAAKESGGLQFRTGDSIVGKEELPDSIRKLMETGDNRLKEFFKYRDDYSGIRFKLRRNPYLGKVMCLINGHGAQYLENLDAYGEYFLSFAADSTVIDRRMSGRLAFIKAGDYQPGIGVLLNTDEEVAVIPDRNFIKPLTDTIAGKMESELRKKGKFTPQKRSEIEEFLKVDAAFRFNLRGQSFYYVKWKQDKDCFEICCSERHSVYDASFTERFFSNSECDI